MKRHFQYYKPIFLQKVGYIVFYLLHRTFVRIEVKGKENLLNVKGPVILASNHTSELDATTIPLALSFFSPLYPIYYVANPMDKYNNFGWRSYIYGTVFFNALGAYSVHSGYKDYAISLEDHIDLLEMGRTVFIFPEGKRTNDGKLSPGRGGLGYLVYKTRATVVPMAIDTFYDINWRKYFGFKRKVVLTVLPPINADEIATVLNPEVKDYQNTSQLVMDKIGEVL